MSGRFLIPRATLEEMAQLLDAEDRDEMAIPSYLHKNPALRRMAWARLYAMVELIEAHVPSGGTVVDYGCGTGVLFEATLRRAARVYGVDLVLDAARLWVERRRLDAVSLHLPDDVDDAVADGAADVVLAAEVLEHIEPVQPVLARFHRMIKPGGWLLVSLPTENTAYRFGRKLAGFEGHYHHANARTVDVEIKAAGFRVAARRKIPGPGPLSIYWVTAYQRP